MLADFAFDKINEVHNANTRVLGREADKTVYVDGRKGAPLTSVKPDGMVIAEWELFNDVLAYIGEQLVLNSPVLTGRYQDSHVLYCDGVEHDILSKRIPLADEYAFVNLQPYARKIERGLSDQAPDGVYEAVAVLARRRFGNVAKISFSYRTAIGGAIVGGKKGDRSKQRNPAIIVTTGVR
jgi:hypothetical protein